MTTRARIIPALAAAVVAVAAIFVGAALFVPAFTGRHKVFTDGSTITEPANAPSRTILWQRPTPVAPADDAQDEYEPKASRDGQAFLFVRGRAGQNADLFVKFRNRAGEWSEPRALGAINTTSDELGPELSSDGSILLFYSNRPGGVGGFDLWASRRNGPGWEGWSEPFNLGPTVNSPYNEYSPALTPDASALYFASSRPRPGEPAPDGDAPWAATVRENRRGHDYDLFRTVRQGDEFAAAEPLVPLNTTLSEGTPAVSPNGDFLYFSSDRAGGRGGYDLYRARITPEGHGRVENLGPTINTNTDELDPAISMGGFALDFSSNRPPESGPGPAPGTYTLYHSESREVYSARTAPAWTLASLWATASPWLLWLLLLILLLTSVWLLGATLRNRTLSILARCILGSAIVHVMVLFLLSLWGVTNSIGELMKKPGGGAATKIRLANAASSGGGVGLAEQVRGDLVSAKAEPAPYEVMTVTPPLSNGGTQTAEATPTPAAPESARFVTHTGPLESTAPARTIASEAPAPATTDTPARVAVPQAAQPESSSEQAAHSAPASARQASGPAVGAPKGMAVAESRPLSAASPTQSPSAAPPSIAAAAPASAHPQPAPHTPSAAAPDAPAVALQTPAAGAPAPAATAEVSAAPSTATPGKAPAALAGAGTPRTTLTPESTVAPAVGGSVANTPTIATSSVAAPPLPSAAPRAAAPEAAAPTQAASLDLKTPAPAAEPAARAAAVPEAESAASVQASAAPKEGAPTPASGTRIGAVGPAESTVGRANVNPSPAAPVRTTMARTDVPSRPPGADVPDTEALTVALAIPKGDASLTPGRSPVAAEAEATISAPEVPGERGRAGASLPFRMAEAAAPAPAPVTPRPDSTALGAGGLSLKDPRNKPPPSPDPELPGFLATDLRIPTETESPYAQRAPEIREKILEQRGGDPRTEEAVRLSLAWLATHQGADGRWSSGKFDDDCGECSGPSTVNVDGAVTGLAVLCFLGADHTHMKDGPYRETVSKAVDWLLERQDKETGDFRHGESMYTHAIITIAMAESSGMTKDPRLTVPLTRAVRFIEKARSSKGGWRYEPGQAGDTSVLGWQVMAMVSGRRAGVTVSPESLRGATTYLDSISRHMPGKYMYQPGQPPTASMTAEGLFCRQLLGDRRNEPRTAESLEFLAHSPPKWGKASTTYYWYYCTLALFQHGGAEWTAWNRQVKRELLNHQRTFGKAAGSWDPVDRWSLTGGRVYQTAICTLTLEVYYRYLPMYDQTAGPGVRAAAQPAPPPIPAPDGE